MVKSSFSYKSQDTFDIEERSHETGELQLYDHYFLI